MPFYKHEIPNVIKIPRLLIRTCVHSYLPRIDSWVQKKTTETFGSTFFITAREANYSMNLGKSLNLL